MNHLATASGSAGRGWARGGSGAKLSVLDSTLGAGLTGRYARFGGWLFGFWIKNLGWFRGTDRFFRYGAFLLFSEFLFFL